MRAKSAVVVVALTGAVGCVPVHRRIVHSDQVLARADARSGVTDVEWTGSVRPTDAGFEVNVSGQQRCAPEVEQQVLRHTHVEKTADRIALASSIAGGVLFGSLGGVLLYDNRAGASPDSALVYAAADPAVGRVTGIALVSVGALSLVSAVIGGLRARDEDAGSKQVTIRTPRDGAAVACGQAPRTGVQISLRSGSADLQVGTLDEHGRLAIPYSALPDTVLFADMAASTVSVRASTGKRTFELGQLALGAARQVRLAARWRDAETADDPAIFEALAALDPVRAEHGLQRARSLRIEKATKALAARDATRAAAELEMLAAHHRAGPDLDALRRDLDALRESLAAEERERARERTIKAVEEAVAAAQLAAAGSATFRTATSLLDQARATYAGEARLVDLASALAKARKRRMDELVAAARTQLKANKLEDARQTVTEASAVDPTDTRVAPISSSIDETELRAFERQARAAIAAGRLDDATAAVERGLALRADDARMLRLVGQIRATAQSARSREEAERERAREATFAAHLSSARRLARGGDFAAARRAVAEARAMAVDDRRLARAAKDVDEAELVAIIGRANKAVAAKQLDEAMKHVEQGIELSPEDPRLARLIERVRRAAKNTKPKP